MATLKDPTTTQPTEPNDESADELLPLSAFQLQLDVDPGEITRQIVNRTLAADSLDELFAISEGTTAKSHLERPFQFQSVEWTVYESDNGPIPNAIIKATAIRDGEVVQFAATSPMITSFLRRAELLGAFPFEGMIREFDTRAGFKVQKIVRVR